MFPPHRSARATTLALAFLTLPLTLSACGGGAEPDDVPAAPAPSTAASAVETTSAEVSTTSVVVTTTSSAEASTAAKMKTSETATSGTKGTTATVTGSATETTGVSAAPADMDEAVAEVYETFEPIAPRSLFEQFTSCDPAGLKDSFNCSGPEVGQFQFFKSDSKAAQTTQVLTELRSSRVLEDDGDRVVGWSTFGTTAVLTVVDNSHGLVMQQMISTDQADPEVKLRELDVI
ncbi:hypothetical protein CPHO_09400 [Corynebacterium phocae]|uniref:Beta-N-acetylglucosaminidase n=1 Tax=Corynebacterium phocae TaxID=161895 RepID=A0A1L7D6U7_9CORY|nr:hypothetical protein CPHO_09400 [Corynebacterium phocae]